MIMLILSVLPFTLGLSETSKNVIPRTIELAEATAGIDRAFILDKPAPEESWFSLAVAPLLLCGFPVLI